MFKANLLNPALVFEVFKLEVRFLGYDHRCNGLEIWRDDHDLIKGIRGTNLNARVKGLFGRAKFENQI